MEWTMIYILHLFIAFALGFGIRGLFANRMEQRQRKTINDAIATIDKWEKAFNSMEQTNAKNAKNLDWCLDNMVLKQGPVSLEEYNRSING
jgi:hypothetical protein